ncbi:MFS transporter [Cumulibacter soli]|uniref:MFS transporter n=1 Tax=Cumulibacter soli TaxID=2546344 RepID=UPI001ABB02AB|nr:MFS transporter [Cumulibacter soli]
MSAKRVPLPISIGLGTGNMLQPLNSSMIAVAVVPIALHLGSADGIAWIISALYIATAVSAPSAGRLGTVLGARRVYLGGLAVIAAGSLLGAFASSLGWLIAARVLQGIGTASQYPTAMTIIRTIVAKTGASTNSAIAVMSMCAQSTVAFGPTLGGLLVSLFGWQAIMWINLPLVLMSTVWVLKIVPKDPPLRVHGRELIRVLDPIGLVSFTAVIATMMFVLLSLVDDPLWWLIPVFAAVTAFFVWWERRQDEPFVDVRALAGNRSLMLTLVRTTATYAAFYCIFFGIPQWLQASRGLDASVAGLVMLPIAVIGIVSTLVATRTVATRGIRWTLLVGSGMLIVSGLLIVFVESASTSIPVLLLVACVFGIPNGFNNIGNQNAVNAVTTVSQIGPAIGMYRTVQYVGANLASVVIELTGTSGDGDSALHLVGWFIVIVGAALVVGSAFSRRLRQADLRARARIRWAARGHNQHADETQTALET